MSYSTSFDRQSSGYGQLVIIVITTMVLSLVLAALFGLLAAIPVYYLWNWLLPSIFGATTITYWQAWGISLLASLLFKSSANSSSSRD